MAEGAKTAEPNSRGSESSTRARGGRPSKLTEESVGQAIDELEAEDGTVPSVRKLQERIGGGRSRLSELREQVLAKRLIASAAPAEGGATAKVLARATSAALTVLAIEALRGADRSIDLARREADARVEEVERIRAQAERTVEAAVLERERALGQVSVLERGVEEARTERETLERELARARDREREARAATATLRAELSERKALLSNAEADRDASNAQLTALMDTLEQERGARASADREAEQISRERDAAVAARRADAAEALSKLEIAFRERDAERAARERAESDGATLVKDLDALRAELSLTSDELERTLAEAGVLRTEADAARESLERERGRQDERDRSVAAVLAAQQSTMSELIGRLDGTTEAASTAVD